MKIEHDNQDIVELGVASAETRGGIRVGAEPGGKSLPLDFISDDD